MIVYSQTKQYRYNKKAVLQTECISITNLNLKENILTFQSPLIRTTNNITLDLTATNYWTKDISNNLFYNNNVGILCTSFSNAKNIFQVSNNRILINNDTISTTSLSSGNTSLSSKLELIEQQGIYNTIQPNAGVYYQDISLNSILSVRKDVTQFLSNRIEFYNSAGTWACDASNCIVTNLPFKVQFGTTNNYNTVFEVNSSGITSKTIFGSNTSYKIAIRFQTFLNSTTGSYYRNFNISNYYTTGQTIYGKNFKGFKMHAWTEDMSIISKVHVYIVDTAKFTMLSDNYGSYLSSGSQCGFQSDNDVNTMTFISTVSIRGICILENIF